MLLGIDPLMDDYLAWCIDEAAREAGIYRELRLQREAARRSEADEPQRGNVLPRSAETEPSRPKPAPLGPLPGGSPGERVYAPLERGIELKMAMNGPIINGVLPFVGRRSE